MCNHELKRLFYTSDDDYGIQTCMVELEKKDEKRTLSYCEKCGQVFVMEIAEKDNIRVGDEVEICGTIGIVTRVPYLDEEKVHFIAKSGTVYCNNAYAGIKKTGRHFDEVEELLKKMKG